MCTVEQLRSLERILESPEIYPSEISGVPFILILAVCNL